MLMLLVFAAQAAIVPSAAPLPTIRTQPTRKLSEVGGWEVWEHLRKNYCFLRADYDGNVIIRVNVYAEDDATVYIHDADWSLNESKTYSYSFVMGRAIFSDTDKPLMSDDNRLMLAIRDDRALTRALSSANQLAVVYDRRVIGKYNLSGSANAMKEAMRCTARSRLGDIDPFD